MYNTKKIDFIFQNNFRFTAKLRGGSEIPHRAPLPPPCHLPHYQYPSPEVTFVTTDEPTLTCQHRRPQFLSGFMRGVVHSLGLDRCVMTCIHHYKQHTEQFHGTKSPLCSVYSSLPLIPASHRSFYSLRSFTFSRVSCSWTHMVCSLSMLALFTQPCAFMFLHVYSWFDISFLFSYESYSIVQLYHDNGLFLHHLLKDILVSSNFWQL